MVAVIADGCGQLVHSAAGRVHADRGAGPDGAGGCVKDKLDQISDVALRPFGHLDGHVIELIPQNASASVAVGDDYAPLVDFQTVVRPHIEGNTHYGKT